MLTQLAQTTESVSHARELYAMAAVIVIQVSTVIVAHVKGRKRPAEASKQMDRALANALTPVSIKLDSLQNDVQDLRAHVIGPDGQNGLRGDFRDLKEDVRGLLERERRHGPPDRRSIT